MQNFKHYNPASNQRIKTLMFHISQKKSKDVNILQSNLDIIKQLQILLYAKRNVLRLKNMYKNNSQNVANNKNVKLRLKNNYTKSKNVSVNVKKRFAKNYKPNTL